MSEPASAAFLSYVHSDDDHDIGRISGLRKRLEGEVRMHLGQQFRIFQDRNDLDWGQNWAERIDDSLNAVSFLIPVVTPSFFRSPACRQEFETFSKREQSLGTNRLILPIYYLDCDEIEEESTDIVASLLKTRQWSDWRSLRFFDLHSPEVSTQLANQAVMIKRAIKELESLFSNDPSSKLDALVEKRFKEIDSNHVSFSRENMIEFDEDKLNINLEIASNLSEVNNEDHIYRIFTKEFDEIISASELVSPAESIKLGRRAIDLAESISDRYAATIQKKEAKLAVHKDTAISILVDNSGSLKGEPIANTAAWSLILLELFDRIGWETELVGFTTRSWKGGLSREKWLSQGRPPSPGRLADLRYIIYKGFDESLVGSAQSIGVMLKDSILKENIDGEALEWAMDRVSKLDKSTKIVLVLSDGAPVDDSTLSVNSLEYLENHLVNVLENADGSELKVLAVGINHDVTKYYGKSGVAGNDKTIGMDTIDFLIKNLS